MAFGEMHIQHVCAKRQRWWCVCVCRKRDPACEMRCLTHRCATLCGGICVWRSGGSDSEGTARARMPSSSFRTPTVARGPSPRGPIRSAPPTPAGPLRRVASGERGGWLGERHGDHDRVALWPSDAGSVEWRETARDGADSVVPSFRCAPPPPSLALLLGARALRSRPPRRAAQRRAAPRRPPSASPPLRAAAYAPLALRPRLALCPRLALPLALLLGDDVGDVLRRVRLALRPLNGLPSRREV